MPNDRHSVDLTTCDQEPIHLLGTIQPFGFLIGVSRDSWSIVRVSKNSQRWLGIPASELIGKSLDGVFSADAVHAIRGQIQIAILGDTTARLFAIDLLAGGLSCDVALHLSQDLLVIECEPTDGVRSFDASATVRAMMARLRQTEDLRSFCRVAAREMRGLTGFDRVMVYRFAHDGSGEVVAESARSDLETFLGLHYPASDIPQQARLLYEKNWLRIIPDINAEPVPVEPELDHRGQPIDLSLSILRSVSSIHIEYLRNMGVQASMSISILKNNKLWGLFACHHYSPCYIGFARRTAAELFGQMFSLTMENRETQAEAAYEGRAQRLHQNLITLMASERSQVESVVSHLEDIADLLVCDGVGLSLQSRTSLKGQTPNSEQFGALVTHLQQGGVEDIRAFHEIAAEFPPGRDFAARAAGMLVVPLSRPARDYLIFFRQEVTRTVNWAGDPTKSVTVGPLGDRLTPRRSFELWRETVRGQSLPWTPVETRIAENLRVSLLEVILHMSDLNVAERRRSQERQELLIAELNHRVRNILSLIRGVINQSKDSAQSIDAFTGVVGGRIQALARAHDQITADNWGPASVRQLIANESGAYLGSKSDRIVVEGPDALIQPEAFTTVALVLHEMITNSAKYGALSDRRGRVDIAMDFDQLDRFVIEWAENGGPPVKPPTRRGFGSTVIERSIEHDLKGESRIEYALAGVKATFKLPARYAKRSAQKGEYRVAADVGPARPEIAIPNDVLVVEDNMIINLDAEDMLRRLGVPSVRTASSCAQALKLIDERLPDFTLLDVNLGHETSFEVASVLSKRAAAFAFTTGYGEQVAFPDEFANAQKMRKPYSAEMLFELIGVAASGEQR